jgi:hypothetical protein
VAAVANAASESLTIGIWKFKGEKENDGEIVFIR